MCFRGIQSRVLKMIIKDFKEISKHIKIHRDKELNSVSSRSQFGKVNNKKITVKRTVYYPQSLKQGQ